MYITDIVYLLDVLVVIVYMSYCNCWDDLLLHEDWGECFEDWAGACRCGGGNFIFFAYYIFFFKNVPGVYFSGGGGFWGVWGAPRPHPGSRGVSENDTLLPMTMTCDRLKLWRGPAWRSKVIIRKPWRRKSKKKIKKKILTKP